jgi:hypothetical protein
MASSVAGGQKAPREREGDEVMANRNYKKILGDWQVLYDNLTPRLNDMPLIASDHANLGTLLNQARSLQNQQEAASAQLRDVNQQRRQMVNDGGEAVSRLGHALKSILGEKNEKLIEFGVKPVRRVRRKASPAKKTGPAAETTNPAPAPVEDHPAKTPAA